MLLQSHAGELHLLPALPREWSTGAVTGLRARGGFTVDMRKKGNTYTPIPLESNNGLRNERATIAMARTGDPDSATCQFFINVVDNPRLDYASSEDGNGYAVFGRVVDGMDVVDAIQSVPTTAVNGREDVPVEPVLIESADRVDRGARSSR